MKYKLLICATEYYPDGSGIANVAYNVVEQLKKMDVDCTVCSPTGPDIILGSSKLIKKSGIIGLLYYWYQVSKYFKGNGYDAAWLHNPLFIEKSPFKNVLVTMNATVYGQVIHKIYPLHLHIYKKISSIIEKHCLNKMDEARFTGVGNKICSELNKILKNKNIKYIPNGVNTTLFKPSRDKEKHREQFGIPIDATVILSVGRLVDSKMLFSMMDVFNEIQKAYTKYTLVIAGHGKLFKQLQDYKLKKSINNVIFLGHVSIDDNLPDLYSCSDYFIISSKYEGGEPVLTIAEAMASGLPCIVSNIPNFKMVEYSNSGIVVDFDDVKEASEKINEYLSKDNSEYSKNAIEYISNNFNWEIISQRYLMEFKKIIE